MCIWSPPLEHDMPGDIFDPFSDTANRASKSCSADPIPIKIKIWVLHRNNIAQNFLFWMKLKNFHFFSRPKKSSKNIFQKMMKNQWKSSKIIKNHDFSSFFWWNEKIFFELFLVEKKSEIFSTSSKNIFFEQYTFYEVLRFKFLLESEQPNMVCSRDLEPWKWTENVSRHVML